MRVAFASMTTTQQSDTAGTRRFERIARLLTTRGHDVTVFCGQWWDGSSDEFVQDDLQFRGVTSGTTPSSFIVRLPTTLMRYRPDIIHVRPSPPGQVLAAVLAGKLTRTPVVLEWFGDESLTGDERFLRQAVTRPSRVITPSELVRTEVRERGASGKSTRQIPESIEFSLVESVDPVDAADIVYAHPLDETANLDDLLLALAELRTRDWHATIIGDGPLRAEYEEEASALRIDDSVSFVGDVDRETRVSIYRGAHVFVQTAFREQFPTELLWALACGCLGIAEYQTESSAHELIENYDRGFRVTNPQQMADVIAEAGAYEHRQSDGRWMTYDHDEVIERYLDVYHSLVE